MKSIYFYFILLLFITLLFIQGNIADEKIKKSGSSPKKPHHSHEHEQHAENPISGDALKLKPLDRVFSKLPGDELDLWMVAGTLGNVFQLQEVESVSLPIFVNLIFLGFDGDGANAIELSNENFEPWFEHIDHEIAHYVVPLGNEQTTTNRHETASTRVKYRYALNVIKLAPIVSAIIEDVLMWSIRPDGSSSTIPNFRKSGNFQTLFYADAFHVSAVLNSLLEFLDLQDESYTLFVMNPQVPVSETGNEIYGYRAGLSTSELEQLYSSNLAKLQISRPTPPPPASASKGTDAKPKTPFFRRASSPNQIPNTFKLGDIGEIDLVERSQIWGKLFIKEIIGNTAVLNSPHNIEQHNTPKNAQDEEEFLLEDSSLYVYRQPLDYQGSVLDFAKSLLANGTMHEREYILHALHDDSLQSDCLVDSWVSHARYAWIDMSAGPFTWGPIIAAEGIHTFHSLPKTHLAQDWMPEEVSEDRDKEYFKVQLELHQQMLKAYCDNESTLRYCVGLRAKIASYQRDILVTPEEHDMKIVLKQMEAFKDPHESSSEQDGFDLAGSLDEGSDITPSFDAFLAQLSATLSRALHHLFTPPTPLFPTTYYDRVTFHVFLISNHDDQAFPTESPFTFDYKKWKREIMKLKQPEQEFRFIRKKLLMSDDIALGMAYVSSLRSVTLPGINSDGAFFSQDQAFLDSVQLQYQLRQLTSFSPTESGDTTPLPLKNNQAFRAFHLPVLLFSVHHEEPLLIDKYYQAKALDDMVVIVQSSEKRFRSRLSCNNHPIYWNLRNPTKAALAATAVHLGGLVPTHLGYSPARQAATQDWSWSVGDNPFSHTSSSTAHTHFNQIQQDIATRNYITHALNQSIHIMNDAIQLLHAQPIAEETKDILGNTTSSPLDRQYYAVLNLWLQIIDLVSAMKLSNAVSLIPKLQTLALQFDSDVSQSLDALAQHACLFQNQFIAEKSADVIERSVFERWGLPIFLIFDCIIILAYYFLSSKTKTNKVKIN